MPGGPEASWEIIWPVFEAISAKVDGVPCVTHIGPGGAGHYVKMVHNGIEYGDMQLICEAYNIFKAAGFFCDLGAGGGVSKTGTRVISSPISSRLRARSFTISDEDDGRSPVVDLILDKAGQKGTGQWTLALGGGQCGRHFHD